jgi:hypothetical protein
MACVSFRNSHARKWTGSSSWESLLASVDAGNYNRTIPALWFDKPFSGNIKNDREQNNYG